MKKINVMDLEEGCVLAKPVISENNLVLLYEGAKIKKEHIKKLEENEISYVYVNDEINGYSSEFEVENIQKDSQIKIKTIIENMVNDENDVDTEIIEKEAIKIIEEIVEKPQITSCLLNIKRKSTDIYEHMLNVASLSTIIGIKIGLDQNSLNDVATGALIHDIGLCDVGVPYENVEMDRMPAVDKLNYRKHVIQGYESLQKCNWMNETTKAIVLSHHERMDGSGYPFHKIGERIPIEVRLVSICDNFDEITNGIGYKKRKVHEVVEYFRTNGTYLFDYDILSLVIENIARFPIGSKILTNEGEIAEIITQNKDFPDRPIIKVIKNSNGMEVKDGPIKNLTELLTVFIVDTVD